MLLRMLKVIHAGFTHLVRLPSGLMRPALIQTFRIVRRVPVWKSVGRRPWTVTLSRDQPARTRPFSAGKYTFFTPTLLHSSMHLRNLSLVVLSTVVASGAWYAYQGNSPKQATALVLNSIIPTAVSFSVYAEDPVEAAYRALLVDNEQISSAAATEGSPLYKTTSDSDRGALEMLTPEQATQILRKNEESYQVNRGKGVVRYDVVQVPSNWPIEDDHTEKVVEVPSSVAPGKDGRGNTDWMFWAVFDGHSGWTTSAKLRNVLVSYVARELNATYKTAAADPSLISPASPDVDAAIKQGFMRLDNDIVYNSVEKAFKSNTRRAAAELLAPALSGSCALLAFYDSQSSDLKIACAGDSRAVLGRRGPSGKWTAIALSEDQTAGTPSEIERLQREHPGEPHVSRNGRVLGNLEPSRSFGDAFYKWSKETQEKIKQQFFGRSPHPLLKTPPYVTAEPIITTTKIEPAQGDFLVIATDGLWEMLTNEEVVGLVGQWIEQQQASGTSAKAGKEWLQSWFKFGDSQLPVEAAKKAAGAGQRRPFRQQQYDIPDSADRFVVEDKNAATHLVRNAMGGKDKDMLCALLTLPSPYSRRYRDDITVEVIFFGNGPDTRAITVNEDASTPGEKIKAKL